jgi:hypothetical protein
VANSLRSFRAARDGFARLVAARPELAFELADTHGWVAQALEASGDYAAAIDAQQARLAVLRGMPDAARDSRVRLQMANTRYDLARLKLSLGNGPAAEEDARAALTQTEVLVEEDTSNLVWLAQACFDRLRLADVELALGRATQAQPLIERAGKDVARLVASDASALNWNVDLQGLVVGQRARIALAERRAVSRAELQNYVAQISGLESSGIQFDSSETEIVAAAELLAGDAANRDGESAAARAYWTAAAHRLQAESAGHDYAALTLLGRAQLRLGDFAAARRLLALVGASSYRHPAYVEFANELAQAGAASRVTAHN